MNLRELKTVVEIEFENSQGQPGQEISQQRALAYERYLSKPMGNEEPDQSKVRTSEVSDVVDGMMPALLKIFTTKDNLLNFDPVGRGDIEKAQQESDYVNHVFFKAKDSFMNMFMWMWDALVMKNGVAIAWWDTSDVVTEETYEGHNEAQITQLLDDPELEPLTRSDWYEHPTTGEEVMDLTFRRVVTTGKACWAAIPPDEYRISGCKTLNPDDARMVGRECNMTRSELIEMGFLKKQVMSLPVSGENVKPGEDRARKDSTDERNDQIVRGGPDKSQDPIVFRECYIKVDYDGDGRAELRQVFMGGGQILRWQGEDGKPGRFANEIVDRQPFHVLCPHPIPHKHFGRSEAEKHIETQDNTSTLWRQIFMNLYHTNNPKHNVWDQAMTEDTLDDLLNVGVGGVNRFGRPLSDAYQQQTVPFTAGASLPILEWQDKLTRDRSGVSSDADALSPDALKNIQQTVMAQANDIATMKREAIVRIFAETGIKSLMMHLHELLQKHSDNDAVVRIRDELVQVSPREWKRREDMSANIGLGIGTRTQNLMHLNAIWDKQSQLANPESGQMNLTVTPQNMYNTAVAIVRNASFEDPNLFFTDPENQMAAPPSGEEEKLQQQEQQLEQRRQQLDAAKYELDQKKVEIKAQEMALDHQREMNDLLSQQRERDQKYQQENQRLRQEMMETVSELERKNLLTPLEAEKLRQDIRESQSREMQNRASALKTATEARGQDIENDASETGLLELTEAINGDGSEEDTESESQTDGAT